MAQGGRLAAKTALISGGASGIGAATARRFVAEGARVALGDVQVEKGEALARELGEAAVFVRLDVTSEADWAAAVHAAQDRFGLLTTVVNSAGISVPASIEQESLEGFRRTLAINLEGTFLGCKAGVAALKGGQGGSIINLGSALGVKSGAPFAAYSASKGGVRLLTRSVAIHCGQAGYDIRCNCILPGAIHTEMVEGYVAEGEKAGAAREQVLAGFAAAHPLGRLGRPHEPADAIVFLASDESSFITGADLPVDGGMLA